MPDWAGVSKSGYITVQKQFNTQKGPKTQQNAHFATQKLKKNCGGGHCPPQTYSSIERGRPHILGACGVSIIVPLALDLSLNPNSGFASCASIDTASILCISAVVSLASSAPVAFVTYFSYVACVV